MEDSLSLADVESIVRLVASASDPTADLTPPERKRLLLEGTKALIDADVYIWSSAVVDPDRPGEVGPTCIIDGGWTSAEQKQLAFEALTDASGGLGMMPPCRNALEESCSTLLREEFLSDDEWKAINAPWQRTGLLHSILMTYPVSKIAFSGIGFHRSARKSRFSNRDKAVVHVVFRQVAWLHLHGTNETAGDAMVGLSPRQRQVLLFLLEGDGKKQIAARMKISEHTVGDHVKNIFKRFNVHSRGELQAVFLMGENPSDQSRV